jgi:hypothetical protein
MPTARASTIARGEGGADAAIPVLSATANAPAVPVATSRHRNRLGTPLT